MTGPIRRFATFLARHGYLVAVPEVYHELEPSGTVLAYDQAGSDNLRERHLVRGSTVRREDGTGSSCSA